MEPLNLTGSYKLVVAILLGMFFGFFLVKSDLSWRKNCLNMLLLKDGSLLKTLLLSITIGVTLFFLTEKCGLVNLRVRPSYFWASLIGGITCGLGIAFCCRVPVTAIVSLASGRIYVLWTIAGMLLAIPFVKLIAGWLSNYIYDSKAKQLPSYFDADYIALWVAGIALLLGIFVHFTLGKEEGGGK